MATPSPTDERGKWMALTAALLGWMFDGLEMGLMPLAARPAFTEMLGDDKLVPYWFSIATAAFLVGAATGGVLFGWLGDRIGRVRAMMLSVLTYALFSGACGFAQSPWHIAVLRFISALGMGGEWSLGVALVMEIWPDRSRAFLAGLIGAAANVGFLIVGLLNVFVVKPYLPGSSWKWLFFFGATPALLTFFIRFFVPESSRWEAQRDKGQTSHWMTRDLLGVLVGAAAAVAVIYVWASTLPLAGRIAATVPLLVAVAVGYLYPVVKYLQRVQAEELRASLTKKRSRTLDPDAPPGVSGMNLSGQPGDTPPRQRSGTLDPYSSGGASIDPFAAPPPEEEEKSWRDKPKTETTDESSGTWQGLEPETQITRVTLKRMLLGACLGGIALLGTWAAIQQAPGWAGKIVADAKKANPNADVWVNAASWTQISLAIGAIGGTILGAMLGGSLGRRLTYILLCCLAFGSALLLYQGNKGATEVGWFFLFAAFLAGALTGSFYGWLPLYLPELFRTRVRATGQGFSFNFGRVLAAVGALQSVYLFDVVYKGDYATVCSIMSSVYLLGLVVIWFVPETKGQALPE